MPKHRAPAVATLSRPRHDRAQAESAVARFHAAVNMTAAQIAAWLETPESRSVGQKRGGRGESVGHASGRRIVGLLVRGGGYSPADRAHMRKVAGYVARHLAQRPAGDLRRTRWRYSLMNWGHDPLGLGEA